MASPNRRTFLQTTAIASASLVIPQGLYAGTSQSTFCFIHADSGISWPVADPVQWCLDHRHQPVLERAAEGLAKLNENDGDRIIRLAVRRCRLNLLELHPGKVVIHHWGQQGQADLRPFFKEHQLARPEITVTVRDRKRESLTKQTGDDYLYGDRIASDIPLEHFQSKWGNRFSAEPDDWTAVPGTWSGYAWEGIESDLIPWAALKSAWRRTNGMACLNCNKMTLLVNFGQPWIGMFSRLPNFLYACSACQKAFDDESVKDVQRWLLANLDVDVLPDYELLWSKRVKWELA
jgi:hypothetical protein